MKTTSAVKLFKGLFYSQNLLLWSSCWYLMQYLHHLYIWLLLVSAQSLDHLWHMAAVGFIFD